MNNLIRYLFVVQYDYRDSTQANRARMLLPLISVIAILAFVFGVFLVAAAVFDLDTSGNVLVLGGVAAPVLIAATVDALWLTQRGYIHAAAALMGVLLAAIALASLLVDGIAAAPVLTVPLVLIYAGLVYGTRGTFLALVLSWTALFVTAYLQSEGQLRAEAAPLEELMREAGNGAGMLTIMALLLWIFAWNLQRALAQAARVAAQTRTTATAGQVISRILNLNELLSETVDLIRDRFAYFHVQIFMLDEAETYANLAASTGEIGEALLAQGFRVPISGRTAVGDAITSGQTRYVPDLSEATYQRPALLANMRSVLVIPLVVNDKVVGALDIQSARLAAFAQEDIEAMQIMATQISQAIQNARLFEAQQQGLLQNRRLFLESETNLREIERLNQRLTGQSWREFLLERGGEQTSIQVSGDDVRSEAVDWTPTMRQAVDRHRLVTRKDGDEHILAVPIVIRGHPIGAVEVRLSGEHNQVEVRSILQAVVERMAFSLENARLFEQAHLAAEREQQLNQITAQLQGLTSVEDVLTAAVGVLGKALGAERGAIQLAAQEALPTDARPNGDGDPPQPASDETVEQDRQ